MKDGLALIDVVVSLLYRIMLGGSHQYILQRQNLLNPLISAYPVLEDSRIVVIGHIFGWIRSLLPR